MFAAVCKNITEGFCPMLRSRDSGQEVGLPGRISAELWSLKISPPAGLGRPDANFEASRPESGRNAERKPDFRKKLTFSNIKPYQ